MALKTTVVDSQDDMAIDQGARTLAQEARDIAIAARTAGESHERHCVERHADLKRWQEESQETRHQMRNEMQALFAELRLDLGNKIKDLQVGVSHRAAAIYNRMWVGVSGLIVILLSVIGTLIARNGI